MTDLQRRQEEFIERLMREWKWDGNCDTLTLDELAEGTLKAGFDAFRESPEYRALVESLKLALSFAPKGPVPEGLPPMFYHTLAYESEVTLQERIDKAREVLAAIEGKP